MSELDNKKFPYNLTQAQYIENLERQLEEARDLLLQVQDGMSNLSTHSHEGWAIACADDTFNMIEQYVDVIELKEKGDE